ncbi:hypothetical protein ENBRE01_0815 [Enteropsectra breve]|nr:hypothetical protein ENBRE01_0815 [Enteropsectra breve]
MCGIFLGENSPSETTLELLRNRGKDHFNTVEYCSWCAASSVLAIRSSVAQPIINDTYMLQYNGEIYNKNRSDTLFIKEIIDALGKEAFSELNRAFDSLSHIYEKINVYENEMALVISTECFVLFLKDDIGRRSLGYSLVPFSVSSLQYENEVDPLSLYVYDKNSKILHRKIKPSKGLVEKYLSRTDSIKHYILEENYSNSYLLQYLEASGSERILINAFPVSSNESKQENAFIEDFICIFSKAIQRRIPSENTVVLFSGGVDSSLVALFACLACAPGDKVFLINTAFPNSPDRETGRASYGRLKSMFANLTILFVENDLVLDKIVEHRERIKALLFPLDRKIDFNIGAILYFSALEASKYGKIVLMGSGADEVFGGYNKYKEDEGAADFRAHMLYDLLTMSTNNLMRDDRAIGNANIEARFPFLDSALVEWSLDLPGNMLISFESSKENKHVLRQVLRRYGLDTIADFPKKAMQYGTKIQKYEHILH